VEKIERVPCCWVVGMCGWLVGGDAWQHFYLFSFYNPD